MKQTDNSKPSLSDWGFETLVVRSAQFPDPSTGAITTPIFQTATYVLEEIGKDKGFQYTRTNNPTRTVLEQLLASLEGSKYGLVFSTGMAATDAVFHALLKQGDHVVVCDDAYGGIYRLFSQNLTKYGVEFTYVDTRNPDNVKNAIQSNTRLIWLESPTNPLLKVSDIKAIAEIVQEENQRRSHTIPEPNAIKNLEELEELEAKETRILTVVDSTFMTPVFFRPLELGVDIVLHSLTKYLSGHNQLVGGALIIRDDPSRWYYKPRPKKDELGRLIKTPEGSLETEIVNTVYEDLKFIQNAVGAAMSPFDAWLTILGIKTLSLRMKKHEENAKEIVAFLETLQEKGIVKKIYYPGLPSHENHHIAKQQMSGFGGMISFELNADYKTTVRFMNSVRLWSLAESLGAVESMITHPASMTHVAVPREIRLERGITDGLIRLSVGIENPKDLIEDLRQAMQQAGLNVS